MVLEVLFVIKLINLKDKSALEHFSVLNYHTGNF